MPRSPKSYNVIPTSETIPFQISSGAGTNLVVWQDTESKVKLVKCDMCASYQVYGASKSQLPSGSIGNDTH